MIYNGLINYVTLPYKCKSGLIGGGAIISDTTPINIYNQFAGVKKSFGKIDGIGAKHYILSFDPLYEKQITPEIAYKMAIRIAQYIQPDYQILYAVHQDKLHLHVHFVFNTVNYNNGYKYTSNIQDFENFKDEVWLVCAVNRIHLF